jgi:hypothetical protein
MDWQQLLVYLIVATAAAYLLVRHLAHRARQSTGCGGCSSCPASREPQSAPEPPQNLVQIDP